MSVVQSDRFYVMDPAYPPPQGSILQSVRFDLHDLNGDALIGSTAGDTVGGFTVTHVWNGDTITVAINGESVTITGVTFYLEGEGAPLAIFTPTDGTNLETAQFESSTWIGVSTQVALQELGPPCFVAGTMISTPGGRVAIEALKVGDLVSTLDSGDQPIRWIGRRRVGGLGEFAPVRIAAGVLGNDRPLLVSPQHRVLISGWRAELHFGELEVLVPAVGLLGMPGVTRAPARSVLYLHFLFDRHEIVAAEGCKTESLLPGATILAGDDDLRREIAALFPELGSATARGDHWRPARPLVPVALAAVLRDGGAAVQAADRAEAA